MPVGPRAPHEGRAIIAAVLISALVGSLAHAQVFVYPRRPNKSQVRYFDFEWRHVDILVGAEADRSLADEVQRRGLPEPPTAPPGEVPQGQAPPDATQQRQLRGGVGAELALIGLGQVPSAASGSEADAGLAASERSSPDGGVSGEPGAGAAPDAGGAIQVSVPSQVGRDGGEAGPGELGLRPGVDPEKLLDAHTGGVRLYFYERERAVAERATAQITDAYRFLVSQFRYVPRQTFPYILYGSYQEFLQTNLFPLQEGTLGVTSPRDLKLTLPYFGDHRLFEEISTHELAHQFTIQKVRTANQTAGGFGEPLEGMPLWFIEGLAEYYAKRGLDSEAELLVRDLVVNPSVTEGYLMLDFFEDRPWSFLWTYKVGQARCAFLEETYGAGTLQRVLEESPRLVGDRRFGGGSDFAAHLQRITGEEPRRLAARFEAWIKRRAYRAFLDSEQQTPAVELLQHTDEGYLTALHASPSGELLMYRAIDLTTGRNRLVLIDRRAPDQRTTVAVDGIPGVESLHPVSGRNFAVTDARLAFIAESKGRDVIYWQDFEHRVKKLSPQQLANDRSLAAIVDGGVLPPASPSMAEPWQVGIRLGHRRKFDLARAGLVAAYSPAFSPDGRRLAFVGLSEDGTRDVYLLSPGERGDGFDWVRLTTDVHAERSVAWGPEGIVFNSDATASGHYNLFGVAPEPGAAPRRLTSEALDHLDPTATADGRVYYVALDRGAANLFELQPDGAVRRTDIGTGLFDPAPGPDRGLWSLYHVSGRRRLAKVPHAQLRAYEQRPTHSAAEPARAIPSTPLEGDVPYEALAVKNWEMGPVMGFAGAGAGGIIGQVFASASDRLRNHALLLNLAVLGSFDLTDGVLLYINQEKRITWGTGLFQSLLFRADQTFPEVGNVTSGERFFGGLASVRYPFNQFVYLQGDLALGGAQYFLFQSGALRLADPAANGTDRVLLDEWREHNGGTRLQSEVTARFGYDTIRYTMGTGPIAGSSFLLEGSTAWQPTQREVFGTVRLDAERYFPIYGRSHLFVRGGAGTTFGGRLARQFYLSSFDTLRGVPFGDTDWLLGRHFLFSTAELQVPLNSVIRLILFNDIEGIAGFDLGGVGQSWQSALDHRVLAGVLGVNFALGPFILRLHFAKPIGIGAPEGLPTRNGEWVTNFSIRILGFEGLFLRPSPLLGMP
jgi:hypothetical protein